MTQLTSDSPWHRQTLRTDTLRLARPLHAWGPLVLGLGFAVLARLFVEQPYTDNVATLGELRQTIHDGPVLLALVWVLPVLVGALASCTRTFAVKINTTGLEVRRLLGPTRSYQRSEVVSWGFEHGPGSHSNLPPSDAGARVRFVMSTADGYTFSKPMSGREAQGAHALLTRSGYDMRI